MTKMLIVFAFDRHSAARFEQMVDGLGYLITKDGNPEALLQDTTLGAQSRIIVVTRDFRVWIGLARSHSDMIEVLYLRHTSILMMDLFDGIKSIVDNNISAFHRRFIVHFDSILSAYHVINVEELFLDFVQASKKLANILGIQSVSTTPSPEVDFLNYNASVTALLNAWRSLNKSISAESHQLSILGFKVPKALAQHFSGKNKFHSKESWFSEFAVGESNKVAKGEDSLLILDTGWSFPEASHVWSNGHTASLCVPLPVWNGSLRFQLNGFICPLNFSIQVYVGDNIAGCYEYLDARSRLISIDFPIPLAVQEVSRFLQITLDFKGAVSPYELDKNSKDRRVLGLALTSFRIYPEPSRQTASHQHENFRETLEQAGYHALPQSTGPGKLNGCSDGFDNFSVFRQFSKSRRHECGVVLLQVRSEDFPEAMQFCQQVKYNLIVLVTEQGKSFMSATTVAEGQYIIPLATALDEAFQSLNQLHLEPSLIVAWKPKQEDHSLNVLAAQLGGHWVPTADIILRTDEIQSMPLRHRLQHNDNVFFANVYINVPGFIFIQSKLRSPAREKI